MHDNNWEYSQKTTAYTKYSKANMLRKNHEVTKYFLAQVNDLKYA